MKYLALVFALVLTGCALPNTNPGVYGSKQVFRQGKANGGVILSVTPVQIDRGTAGVGAGVGAVVGGLLGRQIGNGSGRKAATSLGAVLGGSLGNQVERGRNAAQGYAVVVKLDSGRTQSYIQDSSVPLSTGMRVVVVGQGRDSRVFPG